MMWIMKDGSGAQTWTAHEDIAETLRVHHGYEVTPVVPASEVREKDELIGRLADWIRGREVDRRANAGIEMKESKTLADDFMRDEFGLRKVGGTWERCK